MEPRWSPDGRDLYFLDGAVRLVAATVRASASGVDVTDLKPLLDASGLAVDIFHTSYDILPGGGASSSHGSRPNARRRSPPWWRRRTGSRTCGRALSGSQAIAQAWWADHHSRARSCDQASAPPS